MDTNSKIKEIYIEFDFSKIIKNKEISNSIAYIKINKKVFWNRSFKGKLKDFIFYDIDEIKGV